MKAPVPDTPQGDFKTVSAGVHPVCYETFAYLGQQNTGQYGVKPQCWLRFAVMDEFTDEDIPRPLTVHMFPMTFSMHEKARLRITIEQSFGKKFPSDQAAGDFDMRDLLGKACQANIAHDTKGDRTYAVITSLMPLPSGMAKPTLEKTIYYDPENQAFYDQLPAWIRSKIDMEHKTSRPAPGHAMGGGKYDPDDSIPF